MAADLTRPRPDIVFLRRRLKREESAPAAASNASAAPLSLSLSREPESREEPMTSLPEAVPAPSSVPYTDKQTRLDEVDDACRLTPVQSAIGSLLIENAAVAGWQLKDGSSGYIYASGTPAMEDPETSPASYKNRPLVEFRGNQLVVGLRGVKELKRAIIVPASGKQLMVSTVGGTTIQMGYEPFTALYISFIGNVLEFRKEDFQKTIVETFSLTTQP